MAFSGGSFARENETDKASVCFSQPGRKPARFPSTACTFQSPLNLGCVPFCWPALESERHWADARVQLWGGNGLPSEGLKCTLGDGANFLCMFIAMEQIDGTAGSRGKF